MKHIQRQWIKNKPHKAFSEERVGFVKMKNLGEKKKKNHQSLAVIWWTHLYVK